MKWKIWLRFCAPCLDVVKMIIQKTTECVYKYIQFRFLEYSYTFTGMDLYEIKGTTAETESGLDKLRI